LDELPPGVRALTTSRRTSVRVSVRPIDLGPMTETEVVQFIESLGALPGLGNAAELSKAEAIRVADACDRLPLAIRWSLSRARTASEALAVADNITKSRKTGDEPLEFCCRPGFARMPTEEQGILEARPPLQPP